MSNFSRSTDVNLRKYMSISVDGGSKMADAKIKKFKGNVAKLNYFHS